MEEENEPLRRSSPSRADLKHGECSTGQRPSSQINSDFDHPSNQSRETLRIRRSITFFNSVMISAGVIIGSGIFISPNMILCSSNGNVGVSLVIWVVGGLTAILSALCYNELALSIPESGGDYCYVTYAFGPAVGFLIPWMKTFLPTANAIVAMTFAQYALQPFFPDESPPSSAVKLLTACGVLLVTAVNILSVKTAVRMQVAFTVAKFLAIGFVVVGGVVYSAQDSSVAENTFRNLFDSESLKSITFLTVSRSFFQVMFSYSGWNSLCYVTEEIEDYTRISLATVISVILVTVSYLIVNLAYLLVLTPMDMMKTSAVAASFAQKVIHGGSWAVSAVVALVALGSYHGSVLTYGRQPYVAARRGHLPQIFEMLHIHRYTPLPGLMLNASPCLILVYIGQIDSMIDAFGFVSWTFTGLVSAAVLILRRKMPNLSRPYKVSTLVPILMAFISAFFVVVPFFNNPHFLYIYSLIFFGVGLLVFYIFVHRKLRVPGSDRVTLFLQKLLLVAPAEWDRVG